LRNVKIEPLIITQEKQDRLKKVLSSNLSHYQKDLAKRRITGMCMLCDKISSHIMTYSKLGVIIVERYCGECLARIKL